MGNISLTWIPGNSVMAGVALVAFGHRDRGARQDTPDTVPT
jgi:hypothetical protein